MAVFPTESTAVYVTLVVPRGNESPGVWVDDSVCVPELSEAVGAVQNTVPVAMPLLVTPDWLLGHPLITGLSTSDENKMTIANQ